MVSLRPNQAQDFCIRLLHAETEDEVVAVLQRLNFWADRGAWRPYGDVSNNRGIVGNQQSSPVAALVEKLVNSIDAVLTAECYRHGIDPSGPDAPPTMHSAVDRFLDVPDGRIQNVLPRARTRLAERIVLVATGTKDRPNYLIVDTGEGQQPDQFPNTFLSLLRENKTRIPFVQGKYNMGGTGVLQFAGFHSFQLVISRRRPDVPANGAPQLRTRWGFTLVRRMDPGPDHPQSTYVYLAPGGDIPSFEADGIAVLPGRYPEPYLELLEAGTAIKLWSYKLPGRLQSLATLDLRYALEHHLQDPALPVRISERRAGYRAHTYDTTMSGLTTVLADKPEDIEPGLDTGAPLIVQGVGPVSLRIVVLTEEPSDQRYPSGIFFNVNGQLHGELDAGFVGRRTKLEYIAESMIVIVDCTSLPKRTREDLFMGSRDRMRQCEERTELEAAIVEYLKDHPGLKSLNARRRQARLATETSEEQTAAVLQELVRSDPTIASLFGRGRQIRLPVGPLPEPISYVGQRYPTYFRIHREPPGGLIKQCPRNRTCRVELETDAANDYFSRTNDPGRLTVRGVPTVVSGAQLWNGKATLRFAPPTGSNVGDRFTVGIDVMDRARVEPFVSTFVLEVEPEATPEPSGTNPPPGSSISGLPHVKEVRREAWAQFGFDELSALTLKVAEDDSLDIYVNMDNIHLKNEIARRRNLEPALLEYWFKWGLALLALGMLHETRRSTDAADDDGRNGGQQPDADPNAMIAAACRGLAVTLVPVIYQLSRSHARVGR